MLPRVSHPIRLFLVNTLFLLASTGCSTLSKAPDKPTSYSLPPASEGLLAQSSRAVLVNHDPNESVFMPIPENEEALRWRLALIDEARESIDLQVFIWSNDESGRLLLDRIMAAAKRGVRVRVLVDDYHKDCADRDTAMIASMPNIQLRRFNPGRVRKGLFGRTLQMSTQFRQLNRRMHNKQLIADGCWAIIGGRNIGNPYFGLSKKYNNRDMDLLISGEVVREIAAGFDEYWNSETAYPGEAMAGGGAEQQVEKAIGKFESVLGEDRKLIDQTRIPAKPVDWADAFSLLPGRMVTGSADSYQDSPEVKDDRGVRLVDQLNQLQLEAQESCIISPYMIPSKEQLARFTRLVKEEKRRLRVLVPSMESNNHTMVHSHYKKYRKKLIDIGVELYEFRGQPSESLRTDSDTPPVRAEFISLHTKAFVLDRRWVLLGSLNVDPRSIKINTEHMLVIDSPALAEQMAAGFESMCAPKNAWAVTLNDKGRLRWTSSEGVRKRQPARGYWQRWSDGFYRLLPIESQL